MYVDTYQSMLDKVSLISSHLLDGYFRNGHVYLMKFKYETFEMFKGFKLEIEKQIGK